VYLYEVQMLMLVSIALLDLIFSGGLTLIGRSADLLMR
jgi:hypothetical protein